MKLNIGVFLLLVLFISLEIKSTTDITYLNCPDGFDIHTANTSNPSQSMIKFFFSAYNNPQHKQRVQKITVNGDTQDLSAYINQMMIPFIAIAVAYFIFLMIIACCNIFEKSCPPCQSWKRDFVHRPYQKFQLKCVMIFALIFAVIIFSICIVMFTSFPVFRQQMQYTKCSLYHTLDITKNGDQSQNWGGFKQLKNQVGNISSLLTTASNQVNNNFRGSDGLSDDDWIIDDMFTMKKANLDIYRNNNDSKVITPNPATTAATPVGASLPLVDSLFITTGLGPNGTSNTMVDDIDKALGNTEILSNQAYLVQKSALILVDSATTIKANTDSSQQILEMYEQQLTSVQIQLNQFSGEYFDKLFDWGLYVIEGLVGFILAASIFIILGAISTQILDILACRTLVNIGWVIYGITYFGIILITFVFLSGGSLAYEVCNYYDSMLLSQTQFNKLGESYSQNVFMRLDVCIYGDGNVLQKFDIAQEMQTVTDLFTNIQTYYDYEDPTSAQYIDKDFSINKIQGWIDTMEKYRLGIYIDSNPALTTDDNPNYALSNLNKYTKYIDGSGNLDPDCPRDIWVFDSTNCTDPNAQVYQATNDQANGLRFTTLNDLCISFNERLFTSLSNPWNQRDFKKRYQQVIHGCPTYDDIVSYGTALINYRDSRYNLFQGLKDQLSVLLSLNNQFNTDLSEYKSRVDSFYSSVSTLNNLVTDKISGLLVSSDCRVVNKNLKFINNVFCKNTMGQVATLGICSIILLVIMIGGIITASVFAMRYSRVEVVEKNSRRIVIPEGSLMSETFEKKQPSMDSSSSSSSEQD